jgi:hypothetical protein
LVASGGVAPVLLKADALSRLQTTSNPNTVQRLTAAVAIGDNVFRVDDGRPFPGGSFVYLTSNPANGGLNTSGPFQVLAQSALGITIVGSVATVYQSGDFVIGVPAFAVIGDGPVDRPVTSALFSTPASGVAASVVFPAQANMVWKLAYLVATLVQFGANPSQPALRIWDGASGGAGLIHVDSLSVSATLGDKDHYILPRIPIGSTRGNALTIDTNVPDANAAVRINAGAWQTPQLR